MELQFHPDSAGKLSANLYDINLLLCVQCKTPDDGQRNCAKYVEFHSKNKVEKLVHLVGFIIRKVPLYLHNYQHSHTLTALMHIVPMLLIGSDFVYLTI